VPWICAFAVGILAGRTSDIALRRGMSALNSRKVVLVTGMVAALAILGTAFATSATVAIICLAISTSGIIFANGAVWAATQDVTRSLNLSGSATGFINAMGNVGGILGPIVTGALAYATSSFVVPLVVAAALALIGALTWLFGMRARPETVVPGGSGDSGAAGSGGAGGSGAEVTA
jgi:nitrate/nitrite transporter NarK